MSNILGAIGGAFSGLAEGIQQQKQNAMQQLLLRAQLTAQGATFPGQGTGNANDPNAGTQVNAPPPSSMNPGAALMSGAPVAVPSDQTPPGFPPGMGESRVAMGLNGGAGNTTPGGTVGSMVPPNTGNQTQSGVAPPVGNTTQGGTPGVPTSQAAVIAMQRAAASGPSPTSSGVSPALAALTAANGGAPSGPVGGDPMGGANSGLSGAIGDYVGAMRPTGVNDLGGGVTMPRGIPPQQAQMLQTLFQAKANQALQSQQQGFQTGLQGQQQTFESGQNALSRAQVVGLNAEHEQLTRDLAKATNSVEYARIDAERQRNEAEMAMLGQSKSDSEMSKIDADLRPIEQQLPAINKFQAITPDMAKTNPALAQQAVFEALQTGLGGATFQSRLAKYAGGAPGASAIEIAQRVVGNLATGQRFPTDQFQSLQQEVALNKSTLRAQHDALLQQDLSQYPMAAKNPGVKNRTTAVFGPAGQVAPSMMPTMADYKAQGKSLAQYQQDKAAGIAQ